MPTARKYWAFLSYSHQDAKVCAWLHEALERFAVPKRLVGRDSREGPLPAKLFPVFRDREELPGSAELGANLTEALEASRYLIVLCSPAAARSRWVNEEIRLFKQMGGEGRILALIVDGEPNATDRPESGLLECFPDALRYRLGADGKFTQERVEPIAADIRKGQETRQIALLRLVAGLLGVSFDELRQRDRERTRRQWWLRTASLTTLAVLLLGTWTWRSRTERMERLEELGREAILNNQPGQAAVLLAESYRMGNSGNELRVMLDHAMRSVDMLVTVHRLGDSEKGFAGIDYSSDSHRLLATSEAGSTYLWRADNGGLLAKIPPPEAGVSVQARFVDNSRRIAVIAPHTVYFFGARGGEKQNFYTLPAAASALPADRQLPGGDHILITGPDTQIRVLNLQTGTTEKAAVAACERAVLTRAYLVCANGNTLTTAALTGSGTRRIELPAKVASLTSLAGEDVLLAGLGNGEGAIVSLTGSVGKSLVHHPGGINVVQAADRGETFATGGNTGTVLLWSRRDGRLLTQLPAHVGRVRAVYFADGGRRLVSVGEDNLIKVWDAGSGALLSVNDAGQGLNLQSRLTRNGYQLATFSPGADGAVKVWDLAAAGPLPATQIEKSPEPDAKASGTRCQGRVLRKARGDGSIEVVDAKSGAVKLTLSGGIETADAELDCDATLDWYVTGGKSGAALLWSAATGKAVARFAGHIRSIEQVQFTAPGRIRTTASDGSTANWSFEREARSPAVISRRVACRVPFELDGFTLKPRTAGSAACVYGP